MANMITAADVAALRKKHPGAIVVCYVNSTAEVKANVDVCCTSANAVQVVNSLPADKEIIFIPDKYLSTSRRKIRQERPTFFAKIFPGCRSALTRS